MISSRQSLQPLPPTRHVKPFIRHPGHFSTTNTAPTHYIDRMRVSAGDGEITITNFLPLLVAVPTSRLTPNVASCGGKKAWSVCGEKSEGLRTLAGRKTRGSRAWSKCGRLTRARLLLTIEFVAMLICPCRCRLYTCTIKFVFVESQDTHHFIVV